MSRMQILKYNNFDQNLYWIALFQVKVCQKKFAYN